MLPPNRNSWAEKIQTVRLKMRNEKILVVEFEESSLNTLMQTLQSEGFQVVTAKDGHEGLLMFESENPDLVILEPMLLKLHGFDLCRKISVDTDKKTPVIITTGFYKGEHYKSEAIETFGAAAFFEKPYKNEDLMTTVHKLLGNGTAKSVEAIGKSVQGKKSSSLDIEESVKEMERSIKERKPDFPAQSRKMTVPGGKEEKSGIHNRIDEMLQDALSDFGLNIEKKPKQKKVDIETSAEPQDERFVVMEETPSAADEQGMKVAEQEADENLGEQELKTEELIEELIQKEEKTEEQVEPEEEDEPDVHAAPPEYEEEEKIEVSRSEEKITQDESIEEGGGRKIFEDYFGEAEKAPVSKNFFGFVKKIKTSLPLMIASTAFVVFVAAGATYYFLKPNKPQRSTDQKKTETVSNLRSSLSPVEGQEYDSSSAPLDENTPNEQRGGPSLDQAGGNPVEKEVPMDETIPPPKEPASTSEFMSMTGLSSQQRQVMLPQGMPHPESRQFEVIEVEETEEEQLGQSEVEISSPLLRETAKNIIQSEDAAERIKVGDLVPIDTVDLPPVATKKVNPKYPPAAYQRGIESTVVFRALISEFGNVLDVTFADSSNTALAFKKACDEAIRQWRFTPAKKSGVNVKVWKTFSIAFKKNKTE